MLTFLFILVAIGVCYATPTCHELHKSQLASLTERMNQMISSLYTPKSSTAETSTEQLESNVSPTANNDGDHTITPYSTYYPYPPYSIPVPRVAYVSPTQYPPPPVPFIPPTTIDYSVKPFNNLYYPHKEIAPPFDFAYPGSTDVSSPKTYYAQPLDFAYTRSMDLTSPKTNHFDHPYMQHPLPQYSFPPLYQHMLYPPPYPYPENSMYPKTRPSIPSYQPPPQAYQPPPQAYQSPPQAYQPPPQAYQPQPQAYQPLPLAYQPPPQAYQPPPQVYPPPPTPYPFPPLYHKSPEMPSPPYYLS